MRKYALLALLALLPPFLSAARLTLRDGSVIYGEFISGSSQTVVFQDDNGVRRRFDLKQVQNIDFGNFSPQAAIRVPQAGSGEADRDDAGDWALIPAGAGLSVRTESDINPQNATDRHTWPAVIAQDVMDERGKVAIPRGTPAMLAVRCIGQPSTLNPGRYVLDLDSVQIGGRRYVTNTEDVPAGYEGALGTLLTAHAGNGAVQALVSGHDIRVPSNTLLSFRLQVPMHLKELH